MSSDTTSRPVTPTGTATSTSGRPASRAFIISAWAVPVMVGGGFAMLAIVPLGVLLTAVRRNHSLRPLLGWSLALAAAYGSGLLLWAIGPDRESSLSKELHPAHAIAICVLGVAVAGAYHLARRRNRA